MDNSQELAQVAKSRLYKEEPQKELDALMPSIVNKVFKKELWWKEDLMKNAKIFLVEGKEKLTPMAETIYVKEDDLQTLLEYYPDLLPGSKSIQINLAAGYW